MKDGISSRSTADSNDQLLAIKTRHRHFGGGLASMATWRTVLHLRKLTCKSTFLLVEHPRNFDESPASSLVTQFGGVGSSDTSLTGVVSETREGGPQTRKVPKFWNGGVDVRSEESGGVMTPCEVGVNVGSKRGLAGREQCSVTTGALREKRCFLRCGSCFSCRKPVAGPVPRSYSGM